MALITIQAKRYAQAALEIALQDNSVENWQLELNHLVNLAKIPEFVDAMNNPAWEIKKKFELLESLYNSRNKMVLNLAFILIEKGKFNLIQRIKEALDEMVDEISGIERAEITTAVPLDLADKDKIIKILADLRGKKIFLKEKVDARIVAGIITRIGGKIIDGSVSGRLVELGNRLLDSGR